MQIRNRHWRQTQLQFHFPVTCPQENSSVYKGGWRCRTRRQVVCPCQCLPKRLAFLAHVFPETVSRKKRRHVFETRSKLKGPQLNSIIPAMMTLHSQHECGTNHISSNSKNKNKTPSKKNRNIRSTYNGPVVV